QVARRRPFADAARGVVVRAVAWAEPAAEVAPGIRHRLALGDAAQVRADADQHQPALLALLGAVGVERRRLLGESVVARALVGEIGNLDLRGALDLFRRA